MQRLRILCLLLLFGSGWAVAQPENANQLAQHYFSTGEYQKALPYCEATYQKDPSKFNFRRYYTCLLETQDLKTAEKILKKQLNANRDDLEYPILLGEFYEQTNETKSADKLYNQLIEDYAVSTRTIQDLYQNLKVKSKFDLAFKALEKGRKTFKENYPLHLLFADYYFTQGKTNLMVEEYMNLLDLQTNYASVIQTELSARLDFSASNDPNYETIKSKLIEKAQKNPNEPTFADLLIWLFVQKKEFQAALVQAQALDRREAGFGRRVYDLGTMCIQNKAYEVARKAFQYVVQLGDDKPFFLEAEYALLNTRFLEITQYRNYEQGELTAAVNEYKQTLNRIGKTRGSIKLTLELAQIQAFYLNQGPEAIQMLTEALTLQGLTDMQRAETKMLLADIHVLSGDVWEASLLYMQIDKDFKFEPIGFEAKFKNARIFYYDGDFDFAQSQLDILKQSTSKLIANDAMKLSILITDNYGLDSNYTAMSLFAQADLFIEQHQYVQAFSLFDSIITAFPYHSLSDEILLRKSKAMQQQGKWNDAVAYLEELLKYNGQDILADDALFQLGTIYADQLQQPEKASEYFKRILTEIPGSLYTIACRNRLRSMRGEAIEIDEYEP